MGQLFAKKHGQDLQNPAVDNDDMAMLDLKAQRDQLLAQRRRLEARAEKEDGVARSLVAQDKKQYAMLALRKREQHRRLALECQGHLGRLEELILSIEMAKTTRGTVEALKVGVDMMRRIQKDIGGVDQVQRLLGEQEEVVEAQQEISAALAGEGGVSAEDEELLAEFSRLQEAAAAPAAPAASAAPAAASKAEGAPEAATAAAPAERSPKAAEPIPA
eukprot:TRINITY_DN55422_c0_g1_i1.p1 TRINITY_DN55422_c0_g1~~TRINITY_DN55422_c0_g1_i1.p1  ORF type:complete len:218 (+),score=78.54 TRINITY_DN55422_c0_g1_i1:36-689(+)